MDLPLHAEVKVTFPDQEGGAYASVVSSNRGVVELMCTGRRQFYRQLRVGIPIVLRADMRDGQMLSVLARVQQCTATYLKASLVGDPTIVPRQRQAVRVEMDAVVRVNWINPDGTRGHESAGRMVDISASGCQIVLPANQQIATHSKVHIEMQADRFVELTGVAVRTSAREGKLSVGVHFENLALSDEEWLRNSLHRRLKRAVI
jgi:hypothetical protein